MFLIHKEFTMSTIVDLGIATVATKGPQFTDALYDGTKVNDGSILAKTGTGTPRKVF